MTFSEGFQSMCSQFDVTRSKDIRFLFITSEFVPKITRTKCTQLTVGLVFSGKITCFIKKMVEFGGQNAYLTLNTEVEVRIDVDIIPAYM